MKRRESRAMPRYEYRCRRCARVTALWEEAGKRKYFWQRRCEHCRSWRLTRIYSPCAVSVSRSCPEIMNEISRLGPVNFVPSSPRPPGPPPGGCPYCSPPPPAAGTGQGGTSDLRGSGR